MTKLFAPFLFLLFFFCSSVSLSAQHSVARQWNDVLLEAIRKDFARPTVHSRNLFHSSAVMYDAWAVYDTASKTYFLGDTLAGFYTPFAGVPMPANVQAAQEEAMSYAAYRLLRYRFRNSPGRLISIPKMDSLFVNTLGYDSSITSTNYLSGSPAALGNYLAQSMIAFGQQDGANEANDYANRFYTPTNPTLLPVVPGNPNIIDPNLWQALTLQVFIDQAGNVFPISTPPFLSPEWGEVVPFALQDADLNIYSRNGNDYYVYHDPGDPALMDTATAGGTTDDYKWGHSLVSVWSSHLDPNDTTMWDISPASIGNIPVASYPTNIPDLQNFYDYYNGGDIGTGHTLNPATGMPYAPQMVKRADYGRVLAEFWADGPDSETPPGHWFTLLNYVTDHPLTTRQWEGNGSARSALEWDVKTYLTLGGTVHDAAVTAWGIKGWYDYVRPISAIRHMADNGQCSDSTLPSYSPLGIPLSPGYIELVDSADVLAGLLYENVGKIKVYAWAGPDSIGNPLTSYAGVDWILADNWWPYQRPSFVTPPFAGYVSGHSTFSRAAAEVMTFMTGDAFFPGGMGEFLCDQNDFLVFEDGPSADVMLQWATYRDASDQCSLSRIWGGIHPPVDDIPGRLMGIDIGTDAFNYAKGYFDCPKPAITMVVPNVNTVTDAEVGTGNFTLTVTYDQDMDTLIRPTVTFPSLNPTTGSLFLNFAQSGWTGLRTFTVAYDVVDEDTTFANLAFWVTGAKNLPGSYQLPFETINLFDIDTENPGILEINPNMPTLTDVAAGTATFSLTIDYTEAMDTTADPLVTFPVENPLAQTLTFNTASSGWISLIQYAAVYDVVDANEVLANIDVRVASATDSVGNPQILMDSVDLFHIEMMNPQVVSFVPAPQIITDADTGTAMFSLSMTFSEPMDTNQTPGFVFPVEDPLAKTLTLNATASGWTNLTSYIARYDVADSSESLTNIDVRVTGFADFVGNLVTVFDAPDTFNIQMDNPEVIRLTPSPVMIADANVGTGGFTLTVEYSTNMDPGSTPVFSFPVEDPLANTLTYNSISSVWTSPRIFVAVFDVVDNDETLLDIDVKVDGALNLLGNIQVELDSSDVFHIDMEAPEVVSIVPTPGTVYDFFIGVNGFSLSVTFSEVMDTNFAPTVLFPVENPLAQTLTFDAAQSSWATTTNYVAVYTVFDADEVLEDIDVAVGVARDLGGNIQGVTTVTDLFHIEMENPSVVRVLPSPSTITEQDTGTAGFSLTVIFDEDMNTTGAPTLTFPVENPTGNITPNSTASSWLNATTYEAVYDVAYALDTLFDIDVEVTDGRDAIGNEQVFFTEMDNFNIMMKAFVGIEDQLSSSIRIYPNPTTSLINLDFGMAYSRELTVKVVDLLGKEHEVPMNTTDPTMIQLDLGRLASGAYQLVVQEGEQVLVEKVLLRRYK